MFTSAITQKRPSRFPYDATASPVLQAAHDRLSDAYGRLCMAVARVEARSAQELAQEAAGAQAATVGAGEGHGDEK